MEKLQISLAAARVNAGLTQDDVAKELHISKQSLVNWENGRTMPTFANVQALAKLYNFPIDNIFIPTESTLSEG